MGIIENKLSPMRKFFKSLFYLIVLLALIGGAGVWFALLKDNVKGDDDIVVYVGSSWNYDSLYTHLKSDVIEEPRAFEILAEKMNLPAHIYPGKYVVKGKLGNRKLIQLFRSAQTTDVKVMVRAGLQLENVAAALAQNLEFDSASMLHELKDGEYINGLNFKKEEKICMFLANTYSFNWATTPLDVVKRFEEEYKKFWNTSNSQRAQALNLSPKEVCTLASIVDGEVVYSDEMKRIAGVYLNRLNQNWPLGADPTILFIVNEDGRQRVLNADLKREHPYNTYLNTGLPPGPIGLPSAKAIRAVLDPEVHNYMYFCAKADLSNRHEFSTNLRQHQNYANAYHRALDREGIRR